MTQVSAPGAARPVTPATILAAMLGDIAARVGEIDGVDDSLRMAVRDAHELASGLDPYLERCTSPESPTLADLARRTADEDWNGPAGNGIVEQEMLSGHVEGQLLQMLIHLADARRVLDIGMFTGYSALAMAEALPPDGAVVACEIDAEVAAFAQRCFDRSPDGARIDVRVGPAVDALRALAADGARFDLVFLDADKAGYAECLDVVLDGPLLEPRGVVVVDNTLMQGQPWTSAAPTPNGVAIARFNADLAADDRVRQVVVPLRDGLTLIRRAGGR